MGYSGVRTESQQNHFHSSEILPTRGTTFLRRRPLRINKINDLLHVHQRKVLKMGEEDEQLVAGIDGDGVSKTLTSVSACATVKADSSSITCQDVTEQNLSHINDLAVVAVPSDSIGLSNAGKRRRRDSTGWLGREDSNLGIPSFYLIEWVRIFGCLGRRPTGDRSAASRLRLR
jgi:hypothetical protein